MKLPAAFLALRERFVARLPERLEEMRAQLERLDEQGHGHFDELKRMAHSLVGAAGLHDLHKLAHSAAELERLADQNASRATLAAALNELDGLISAQQQPAQGDRTSERSPDAIGLLFQSEEEMAAQSALLAGMGYAVQRFASADAIEAACRSSGPPDLLLMGLQFDSDDRAGLSILKQLQGGPAGAIPTIVLSASHSVELGLAAYRAGAMRVLAKPVSPEALSRHVRAALDQKNPKPLDVLAMNGDRADLLQFFAQVQSPQIKMRSCRSVGELDEALSRQRPDAIAIDLDALPEDQVIGVLALIRDHPGANHTPLLAFSSVGVIDKAALWTVGCSAVVGPDTPPAEFGSQLSGLCRKAMRSRSAIADNVRALYEHARQRQALDHHVIMTLADADGTIYETSNQHQQLTGFCRTMLVGANLFEARPCLAPPEFDADVREHVSTGQVWQGEYAMPTLDSRRRWVSATLVPFLNRSGRPYRYMVVRSDITERKLSEQALLEAHQREMQLAAQIQDSLLVPPLPLVVSGVPVASRFEAADGVAGDFHAMIEIEPGVFDVLIGDVMGKGVPAALVGAAVKMSLNQSLLDLRAQAGGDLPQPADIINALHQRLCRRLIELECFVTLIHARFDHHAGTVTSVGCGHPELLLVNGQDIEIVANGHLPLGMLESETYTQTVTAWPPGCLAVMYSDGLTETQSPEGRLLAREGLAAIIQAELAKGSHPVSLSAGILDAVGRFGQQPAPDDDRTLVVVRNPNPAEHHRVLSADLTALDELGRFIADHTLAQPASAARDQLRLAAVEAFSNIVRHGQARGPDIAISLQAASNSTEIQFHHDGPAPDLPPHTELPPPESLQESGYGLALIRTLCDQFECQHQAGSNQFRLVINHPPPENQD